MELTQLKNKIIDSFSGTEDESNLVLELVHEDKAIFPFNEYELLISNLIESGGLNYSQYLDIRTEYISQNPNLWIFEISAPRGFGERFAQTYVMGIEPKIKKASKKMDEDYSGQYDLWLDGIRIEVKASRAVDSSSTDPLYMKALSKDSTKPFLMNFQQLKPQYCDVFLWVAVYRDVIDIWVLNSDEVASHPNYSIGQHRGNKGNEGQFHVKQDNINSLKKFLHKGKNLERTIKQAANRKSR